MERERDRQTEREGEEGNGKEGAGFAKEIRKEGPGMKYMYAYMTRTASRAI